MATCECINRLEVDRSEQELPGFEPRTSGLKINSSTIEQFNLFSSLSLFIHFSFFLFFLFFTLFLFVCLLRCLFVCFFLFLLFISHFSLSWYHSLLLLSLVVPLPIFSFISSLPTLTF